MVLLSALNFHWLKIELRWSYNLWDENHQVHVCVTCLTRDWLIWFLRLGCRWIGFSVHHFLELMASKASVKKGLNLLVK